MRIPRVRFSIGLQMLSIVVIAIGLAGPEMIVHPPRPRASVNPDFDFGTISQFIQIRHTWTVTNDGTAPLHLRFTGSSCPVTPVGLKMFETVTVPPGGKVPIVGAFNTKLWRGKNRSNIMVGHG